MLHSAEYFLRCISTKFMTSIAYRDIACTRAGLRYSLMPEGLFYELRYYQLSILKKVFALHNYLKMTLYVLSENRATHASVLWHDDLHLQNIFVDSEESIHVLSIIDWQSVSSCSLFMQVTRLNFLNYNDSTSEKLQQVRLSANFDSMIPNE